MLIITHPNKMKPHETNNLIAGAENENEKKEKYLKTYLSMVSNPLYGRMYNKYLVYLYTDEFKNYDKALMRNNF